MDMITKLKHYKQSWNKMSSLSTNQALTRLEKKFSKMKKEFPMKFLLFIGMFLSLLFHLVAILILKSLKKSTSRIKSQSTTR